MRRGIVAANWKMHGSRALVASLLGALREELSGKVLCELVICPPSPYLEQARQLLSGSTLQLGAQNCYIHARGAYTGEVSASMLDDLGCRYVLVGHSERRALFGENDALVAQKFEAVQAQGLVPILCVGETLRERQDGRTAEVVMAQVQAVIDRSGVAALGKAVLAYEPIWAIGSGLSATPEQAQEVHAYLRGQVGDLAQRVARRLPILYGGSVKAANAAELFGQPDIDGGLIGGASLEADEFAGICRSWQGRKG